MYLGKSPQKAEGAAGAKTLRQENVWFLEEQ